MNRLAVFARAGDRVVSVLAMILVLLLFACGGYALYDDWLASQGGFSESLMQYRPQEGDTYSLEQLAAINPDVIGWIEIDRTHIDQPLTQGKDDMEYVNKNALGEFALSGAAFLSCQNSPDFSDPYMLTYGHHMENSGMYGDVTEFLDEDYFKSHPTSTLTSLDSVWDIQVFAVLETEASDAKVFSTAETREEGIMGLNDYLKKNSAHYRDIGIQDGDQILSLSTCHDAKTNARILLFGRLENRRAGGDKASHEKSF